LYVEEDAELIVFWRTNGVYAVLCEKEKSKREKLKIGKKEIVYFFFFAAGLSSAAAASGAAVSGAGSAFLSSISVVISSIGFGGGVVAIVHPIHAPMKRIATKATKTGMAMSQNLTSAAEPMLSQDTFALNHG
jgi:hypothetical protein